MVGPAARMRSRRFPGRGFPSVSTTGASLVLFCHRTRRTALVTDLPADTLWDRLNRGDVPIWLHEIAHDPASGYQLFRIGSQS